MKSALITALCGLLCGVATAHAQNATLTYQGSLGNAAGVPVTTPF